MEATVSCPVTVGADDDSDIAEVVELLLPSSHY